MTLNKRNWVGNWVTIFAVFSAFVMMFYAKILQANFKAETEETKSQAELRVKIVALNLSSRLDTNYEQTKEIAQSSLLRSPQWNNLPLEEKKYYFYNKDYLTDRNSIESIVVIDAEGNTNSMVGMGKFFESHKDRDYYQKVLKTQKPTVVKGNSSIYFAAPVFGEDKNLDYIVLTEVSAEQLDHQARRLVHSLNSIGEQQSSSYLQNIEGNPAIDSDISFKDTNPLFLEKFIESESIVRIENEGTYKLKLATRIKSNSFSEYLNNNL